MSQSFLVYFIREVRNPRSPVKIGYTGGGRGGVAARVDAMQTGNPRRLAVVGLCRGDSETEAAMHQRLKKHRIHGEWFRWTRQVQDLVRLYALEEPMIYSPANEKALPEGLAKAARKDVLRVPRGSGVRQREPARVQP